MAKTEEKTDRARRNGLLALLQNALSSVTGSGAIARRAGLQYGLARDMYTILGYDTTIEFDDFLGKYRREDVAGKIVDAPAKATWRKGFRVVDNSGNQESDFIRAWEALAERLRALHHFQRVDRLAGIGRYAIVLIGVRGESNLAQPLESASAESIIFLSAFHEGRAEISKFDSDPASPRFGLPQLYKVELTGDVAGLDKKKTNLTVPVHWSRTLHIAEDTLEDNIFGRPRLERAYNRLDDLLKISGGSAEMFYQNVAGLWWLNISENFEFEDSEAEQLEEKMFEALQGLRRFVQTQGADLEKFLAESPKPKEIFEVLQTLIAAAAGIPQRILFGSERGELASTQDEANWLGEIAVRQETFAEPIIVRAFIDRMIDLGVLPMPREGYAVEWPNLFQLSELQMASAAKDYGAALSSYAGATGDPERIVPEHEFRQRFLGLSPIPPEEPEEFAANRLRVHQAPGAFPGISEFWRTVHLIADGFEPDIRAAFFDAIAAVQRAIPIGELEAAIIGADIAGIERLIPLGIFEEQFGASMGRLLEQAFVRTADLAAREVAGQLGLEFAFDATDSRISRIISEQGARLVREVTAETREAIRGFVSRGFAEGQTPRQMAENIRGIVGLTKRQEAGVARFRRQLQEAGVSGRRLERMTEEFRNVKIRERSIVIARQESIMAANAGQDLLFTQLEQSGLVTNAFREWIVTPDDRLCPICRPMEGQRQPVGSVFVSPHDGSRALHPPIHIQCRCAVAMVFEPAEGAVEEVRI